MSPNEIEISSNCTQTMNSLTAGLSIPHVDTQAVENDQAAQQLMLLQNAQQREESQNISATTIINNSHNNPHRSTNSVSSISVATNNTQSSVLTRVADICNEVVQEDECEATDALVKKCIKQRIWHSCKFITQTSIKGIKIEDKRNPKSLLNILLQYVRKSHLNDLDRLNF